MLIVCVAAVPEAVAFPECARPQEASVLTLAGRVIDTGAKWLHRLRPNDTVPLLYAKPRRLVVEHKFVGKRQRQTSFA